MSSVSTEVKAEEGPVVAYQFPTTAVFTTETDIKAVLDKDYSHLKQLATDDKEGYTELKAALKQLVTMRTSTVKYADSLKKGANEYRSIVNKKQATLVGQLAPIEKALKDEKKRIDDIVAEKKAAMEKLWGENLNKVRAMASILFDVGMEGLEFELGTIDSFNLDDFDFGELIEQAKSELANARIRVEQAIAQEKQRLDNEAEAQRLKDAAEKLRLENEAEELRLKEVAQLIADNAVKAEAERLASEAAARLVSDEIAAYADAEIMALKATLATQAAHTKRIEDEAESNRLKEEARAHEINDSPPLSSIPGTLAALDRDRSAAIPEDSVKSRTFIHSNGVNSVVTVTKAAETRDSQAVSVKKMSDSDFAQEIMPSQPPSIDTSDFDEPTQAIQPDGAEIDIQLVNDFIIKVQALASEGPKTTSKNMGAAIDRVCTSLRKAADYLASARDEGKP